jgi:hypothetical protein
MIGATIVIHAMTTPMRTIGRDSRERLLFVRANLLGTSKADKKHYGS